MPIANFMFRLVTVVLGLLFTCSAAAGDAAWQFDGKDSEGWKLGPRTANLRVADGKLQFDITGPDPWIISPPLDLTVTPQTKVVIRMSSQDGDAGQLYWQSMGPDGKPMPYSEERVVRGFPVASDGKAHEYHVLPTWEGKVREIRLDPPGDQGHIAIDSIRIQTVDIPLAEQLRCEFTSKETEHWIPEGMRFIDVQEGVLNAEVDYTGRIGATLQGMGLIQSNEEGSGIIRPNLRIAARKQTNVAVRMSVTDGTLACIRWYSDLDPSSNASWQDFFIKPDGRFHTYNVDLTSHPTWKGVIRRLELIVNSSPGTTVGMDYVRTGDKPDGPPLLGMGYLSTDRVLYADGEAADVRCLVRNDGGAQIKDVRAVIQVPGEEGEYEQITEVPPLDPGQACEVQWSLKAAGSLAALLGGRAVYGNGPFPTGVCRLLVTGPRDESSTVGNDRVRLVFTKNSYGYGPAFLEMKQALLWTRCGVLPSFGEVVYRSNSGGAFQKMIFGEGGKGAFQGSFKDVDGVVWSSEAKFTAEKDRPWIRAEYSISANANRELIAFRGPMLYAGEGAFGSKKEAALFPGLEWLVRGERSSNWLDATPPRSNRWAPDPYKVTIPLMAVLSERKVVGLMWNALDRWDGENSHVTSHFLSPNWHEAQENHLFSLFVPTIPRWVMENSIFATRPYDLQKDKKLTIACCIFAQEGDDILQAAKNWFEVYGVPELPKKPRSYEAEIDLCLDYFNSRWVEKENCWLNWRDQKIGPSAFLELYLSYLDGAQDTATARRAREIVDRIMALYRESPQRPFALAATQRCWPMSALPFRLGRLGEALKVARGDYSGKGQPGARPGIELQRDDGSWGFAPTTEPQKLLGRDRDKAERSAMDGRSGGGSAGPFGGAGCAADSESGICARAALPILTYARITGDERFTKSGLKALKCLDRFTVPRAAQVWEVPVHTPDILAAAYVLMCYLEGYKITGKQEHLDKAIRWGYAGLPFVYTWGVEDRPVMPFAGIPVFGCTFFVHACWIGRPVQWCALDYAVSLQELARYDKSFPWAHVAEGITISGMHQQSDDGEFKGRYPDSWILRTDEQSWQAMLDPQLILQNVLMLANQVKSPDTVAVRSAPPWPGDVRVTAIGKICRADLKGGVLSFDLENAPYETSHLLIAGLEGVTEVRKNGTILNQATDADSVDEGWEALPDSKVICLKLKTDKTPVSIQVKGTPAKLLPLPW